MPKQRRFVFSQAMRVEPEPRKGSTISLLSLAHNSKNHSVKGTGFCVGCTLFFESSFIPNAPTQRNRAIRRLCFCLDQHSSKADPYASSQVSPSLLSQT